MDQELNQFAEQELQPGRLRVWLIRLLAIFLAACLVFFLIFGALRISGMPPLKQLRASARLAKEENIALFLESSLTVTAGKRRGSGFILPGGDLCLTCAHVLGQETAVTVSLGGKKLAAEILALDPELDLALLRISEKVAAGLDLASFLPQPEDDLLMIGSPFGSGRLVSQMTYLGPVRTDDYPLPLLAVRGPVYQGNSGSPLLDQTGRVTGVLFATASSEDGENKTLGLVIPFEVIQSFLDQH